MAWVAEKRRSFIRGRALIHNISDYDRIVTEDDEAVDNLFSEKQQRLLARSLNAGWKPGRPFMAFANVGLFYGLDLPPVVPDMFLSMDVVPPKDVWIKKHRSYFSWIYGKQPEVAVEIVSNTNSMIKFFPPKSLRCASFRA